MHYTRLPCIVTLELAGSEQLLWFCHGQISDSRASHKSFTLTGFVLFLLLTLCGLCPGKAKLCQVLLCHQVPATSELSAFLSSQTIGESFKQSEQAAGMLLDSARRQHLPCHPTPQIRLSQLFAGTCPALTVLEAGQVVLLYLQLQSDLANRMQSEYRFILCMKRSPLLLCQPPAGSQGQQVPAA